jgi:hypothetical protein
MELLAVKEGEGLISSESIEGIHNTYGFSECDRLI